MQAGALAVDRAALLEMVTDNGPVANGSTVAVAPPAGEQPVAVTLTLRNAASAKSALPLRISSLQFVPGTADGNSPFSCTVVGAGGPVACQDFHGQMELVPADLDAACRPAGAATELKIIIAVAKPPSAASYSATLMVTASGDPKLTAPASVKFATKGKLAVAKVQPPLLDFQTVKIGAKATLPFQLLSVGEADLVISALEVAKDRPGVFSLQLAGKTFASGQTANLSDEPLTIAAGTALEGSVTYTPDDGAPASASIAFIGNSAGATTKLMLTGNKDAACLSVTPSPALDFGYVGLGSAATSEVTLGNCGQIAVHVSALTLQSAGGAFELVQLAKPVVGVQPLPSQDSPLELSVGETAQIAVRCAPPSEQKQPDGTWKPFAGSLGFADDTILPDKAVKLLCRGTALGCPTAHIAAEPALTVAPQQEVHLIGGQSAAVGSKKIAGYKWALLSAPPGATAVKFYPSDTFPNPKLGVQRTVTVNGASKEVIALDVVGDYAVRLQVTDSDGVPNCEPAQATVHVIPEATIFAELVWSTPNDVTPDSGPGAGSDLDLHFAHPNALKAKKCSNPPAMCGAKPCLCQPDLDGDGVADPFFHPLYDCYWNNPKPNWGSVDPQIDDDPSLDLDDIDGFGPETLHLNAPQYGATYTLGVHSWDEHEFGPSAARLRVWVGGQLVAVLERTLNQCDLWWAATVAWPEAKVAAPKTDGKGAGLVVPNYKTSVPALVNGKCGKM